MFDEVISRLWKKLRIKWQIWINHVWINRTQPVIILSILTNYINSTILTKYTNYTQYTNYIYYRSTILTNYTN